MDSKWDRWSRLTRVELYELVWTTTLKKLAVEFGVSVVALGRHCIDIDVPVPPPGFWKRRTLGLPETEQRPPLPTHRIYGLEVPHPLVERSYTTLLRASTDSRRLLVAESGTYLDVRIGRKNLERAMRLFDLLIRGLEARGHRVALTFRMLQSTRAVIHASEIPIWIEQLPDISKDASAVGRLGLHAGNEMWSDGNGIRLESLMATIITSLEAEARRQASADEIDLKLALEDTKPTWEQVVTELVSRTTREKKQRQPVHIVERQVLGWMWANQVRQLIAARLATVRAGQTPDAELEKWIKRAEAYAATYDPFVRGWDEVPPEPPGGSDSQLESLLRNEQETNSRLRSELTSERSKPYPYWLRHRR